jgi:hypothetical protein
MQGIVRTACMFTGGLILAAGATSLSAQFGPAPEKQLPAPAVNWTADQDHQNMMDQLGIKALRPGPSGNEADANHANYDESIANPYPNLPDVLTMNNGTKVTTADQWVKQRRPEIEHDMQEYVYGFVPKNAPKVRWEAKVVDKETVGGIPVIAKHLIGHVENSAYPLIEVNIDMVLVTPANATAPVPVLMMFGGASLPAPAQPNPAALAQINEALRQLLAKDPAIKALLDQYPAYQPIAPAASASPFGAARPGAPAAPGLAGAAPAGDPPTTQQLLAAGWGYASLNPGSIQADNGAGLTRGIIGLVNKGQARKPDEWGALRAWAWGAGRVLDYLETDAAVDAKHVGIEGVSRYGKAALVTEAFDQRFYVGLIGSSGEGGAKLNRRNWGEAVESLTASGEYHWMAGNFMKYGASDASFGAKNPGDIPVDSHELIAMCAPRLTFVSYGVPEKGDAKWLDHQGSYMAAIAAQPVYTLLGAKGLGVSNDYHTEKMPGVNVSVLDGQLAWRQHDGGHTDGPNVKYFISWANKFMGWTPPAPRGRGARGF